MLAFRVATTPLPTPWVNGIKYRKFRLNRLDRAEAMASPVNRSLVAVRDITFYKTIGMSYLILNMIAPEYSNLMVPNGTIILE